MVGSHRGLQRTDRTPVTLGCCIVAIAQLSEQSLGTGSTEVKVLLAAPLADSSVGQSKVLIRPRQEFDSPSANQICVSGVNGSIRDFHSLGTDSNSVSRSMLDINSVGLYYVPSAVPIAA